MQNQEHECNIHHYVPQFLLRQFTSSINTNQKRRLKICWKDKRGFSGNDLIADVCQMFKYNTSQQETYFEKNRENLLSKSIKSVINESYCDEDIYNVKKLMSYIYTDTPNYRKRIINDANKSVINNYELYKYTHGTIFIFDDSIKGRGDMTITAADRMFCSAYAY